MSKHRIELIYERSCPNVEAAREVIRSACATAGIAPIWTEWDSQDPALPGYARGYGSPTILVDGEDVAGEVPGEADCCRLYTTATGVRGVPDFDAVLNALVGQS